MAHQTMREERSAADVTHVSFILEVAADSRAELGDKLYGYDDFEATLVAMGIDPHEEWDYEALDERPTHKEIEAVQDEQETVNDLLENASFDGHGVLFKTDGTNLGSPSEATEVPHFCHGSGVCDDLDACREHPDAGGVYRLFPSADLILDGHAGSEITADYKLREDIVVRIRGPKSKPTCGSEEATRIDADAFSLS